MSVASVPQLLQEAEKFAASHRAYANELAPAYADFHNSVASLLERLAAALTESETRVRALEGDVGASAEMWREWNALHAERDALRAQREALQVIVSEGAELSMRNLRAASQRTELYRWGERARAVLAQGEEPEPREGRRSLDVGPD